MLIKKKYIYLLLSFFLLSISLILGIFISRKNTFIQLHDKDVNFSFSYTETDLFKSYLQQWKIRENGKSSPTRVSITFTTSPQASYVMRDYVTKEMIQSYSWKKNKNSIIIVIHLDPKYHTKLNERDLSLSANAAVLKALYFLSHPEQTKVDVIPKELMDVYSKFQKEKIIPIQVGKNN